MSKKIVEHPPVVYVEWCDSRALTAGWKDGSKLVNLAKKLYRERVVTAGLLVQVAKKYIVVASSRAPNDDYGEAIQIPRSEITKMRILRKQRGGKWKR